VLMTRFRLFIGYRIELLTINHHHRAGDSSARSEVRRGSAECQRDDIAAPPSTHERSTR
jgi:hypothetical protein